MHDPAFLRKLGLFLAPGVLDADACSSLAAEMGQARELFPALVSSEGLDRVDEAVRRTKLVPMSDQTGKRVQQLIEENKGAMECHFGLDLGKCEAPQYLVYRPGDFFRPHRDSSSSANAETTTRRRKVSVVLFVNGSVPPEDGAPDGGFSGGLLTLYGLLKHSGDRQFGIQLPAEPGLLLGFRSDLLHEVTPVLHGNRYTIATWFAAR